MPGWYRPGGQPHLPGTSIELSVEGALSCAAGSEQSGGHTLHGLGGRVEIAQRDDPKRLRHGHRADEQSGDHQPGVPIDRQRPDVGPRGRRHSYRLQPRNGSLARWDASPPGRTDTFGPSGPYPSGILQRASDFFGVERSTDGGVTWSQPVNLVSPSDYQLCWPTVIKPLSDGRLVAFAGLAAVAPTPQQGSAGIVKTMFVSSDEGKTWGRRSR